MRLLSRFGAFFRRRKMDADLDEEIRSTLEMLTEQKIREGMAAGEAARAARIELGGAEQVKESVRAVRAGAWLGTIAQDIRFALRMLRKIPGFTVVAVLTLALGIGVNVTIFSIFDSLLFRLLPVHDPGQLVFLSSQAKSGGESTAFSYPNFDDLRAQTGSVFTSLAPVQDSSPDGISIDGKNETILTSYVGGDFFSMLGVQPALGRLILPTEGKTIGSDPVLVLGYSFWKGRFNGDPAVIGRRVDINGHAVAIVGVAPEGFHGVRSFMDVQGYLPLGTTVDAGAANLFSDRALQTVNIVARLRSRVSMSQAQQSLSVVAARLGQEYPVADQWRLLQARELGPLGPITGPNPIPIAAALFLLLAGLVVLLACLNVTNLLLARALVRRREMAMRAALGASRVRLIRQSLTETTVLALLGGGLGLLLGTWTCRVLSSANVRIAGVSLALNFSFDWRVFAYALGAALVAGLLMGAAPAARASGIRLNDFLHDGGRAATDRCHRFRDALIVAQVAGSLMLLIVAALFGRSLANAQHTDMGFDAAHVLNIGMNPRQAGYSDSQGRQAINALLERVRALPGVDAASFAATVPLGGVSYGSLLDVPGFVPPPGKISFAGENLVTSDYFRTMGIPIILGRAILDSDTAASPPVAVINDAMASAYWHGENPIGRSFVENEGPRRVTVQVVGVVKNSRTRSLATSQPIGPYFYVPLAQSYRTPVTLQVRAADPLAIAHPVLDQIHTGEPSLPVSDVQTMTEALGSVNGFLFFRIGAAMAATLGTLGLLLAVIGVYGVVSYAANQRTQEIGIRVALGAQRGQILAMILRQGLTTVGAGLLVGLLASAALARVVGLFLVGVNPFDPVTYLGVSLALLLVALVACFVPARRAMRVDPVSAMRCE